MRPRAAARSRRRGTTLKRRILGVSVEATNYRYRGSSTEFRQRVGGILETFLGGYHAVLDEREAEEHLAGVEEELRGFAAEGMAMAAALLDGMALGRTHRFGAFARGAGHPYRYLLQAGAGGAIKRLPYSVGWWLRRLDPLYGWLAVDGYGFHCGLFDYRAAFERRQRPRRVRGYARRAFDQGLGRILWLTTAPDVERVSATIGSFGRERQADLWAGVGLAAGYAGGGDRAALECLLGASTGSAGHLAQGVAFAAEARVAGGFVPAHTEAACRMLTGHGAAAAAAVTADWREEPSFAGEAPAYEAWRRWVARRLREGRASDG